MAGLALFTASSLACGVAWSESSLIAFRAIQGLGGAMLAPPTTGVYLGVYNPSVAGPPKHPLTLSRYHGSGLRIIHRFQAWWGNDRFLGKEWLDAVAKSGAVPMVTWEPWQRNGAVESTKQRPRILKQIATGKYDAYVRKWARDAVAYHRPIVLRFMHEMNGDWYPWSPGVNGNTPRAFKAAWRHVHDIFRNEGASNVSWEFSVVANAGDRATSRHILNTYYPGSRYVDWVGVSGFNWSLRRYGGSLSYDDVFRPSYEVVKTFNKPIIFSEVGTTSAQIKRSPAWVRDALTSTATRFPRVKALVWYDARHPQRDFTLRGKTLTEWRTASKLPGLRPALRERDRG